MAFVITDECLSCGSCAAQCPAEAIDMGDLHYEIDADKCVECGSCAAQCPAEAIVQQKGLHTIIKGAIKIAPFIILTCKRTFGSFTKKIALRSRLAGSTLTP